MSKEQTAVDFLKNNIETFGYPEMLVMKWSDFDIFIERAKELEKQNLKDAWKKSEKEMHNTFSADMYKKKNFEQYYNEKYN